MSTLIQKIEKLIKREKTTPERKKKDECTKSSNEILSELFSAFNADPPKIDEVSTKKSKKSKKKHKKEKKKRSRSVSTSSESDDSDYSHRRKKRKKSKSKRRKDVERTPSYPRSPVNIKPEPDVKKRQSSSIKTEPVKIKVEKNKEDKYEPKEKKRRVSIKQEDGTPESHHYHDTSLIPMPESPTDKLDTNDLRFKLGSKKSESGSKKSEYNSKKCESNNKKCESNNKKSENKSQSDNKKLESESKKLITDNCKDCKNLDVDQVVSIKSESDCKKSDSVSIKVETESIINSDVNSICVDADKTSESNHVKVELDKILEPEDKKSDGDSKKSGPTTENDKSKSNKIQIKNLKFSAVFEETVKKAEEEARRKAEKYEEGEYTDSSSSSPKEEFCNSHFPKSSDPGGILKKQAAEEIKLFENEKNQSTKSKHSESSHKSSKKDKDRDRDKDRGRDKDRDSSRSRKRSSSKKRSRSRSRYHRSSSKSHRRSRSRHRSSSRSRRRSTSRTRRTRHHSPRHRARRSRSPTGVKLADSEKKRLLEVARRNAINMLKNGAVPAGAAALPPHTRNQVMAAIQSGGKSVDELTDFCKHLSKKEALGELSSVSSNDDDMSENEDTLAFHHPFLVKEKAPIVMNIRGGAPLPIKTAILPVANKDELRLQFPVSSGTQHREKASEWVPVSPKKDNMQVAKISSKTSTTKPTSSTTESSRPAPLALPAPETGSTTPPYLKNFTTGSQLSSVPALPAPGPQAYPPGVDPPNVDVASIVSQKIAMIRKEQEENELTSTRGFGWSKDSTLGQFTGSTDAQILTPRELASGTQAWAKKDQLVRAAPVEGGMGMHLLQKMGWTPGQGLGKEGTGTLQPLLLEVKLDTKGLQAKEEVNNRHSRGIKPQRLGRRGPAPLVAGGKHPVSLLGEYCSKQKLGPPEYNLCFECGPDHKKNFLFKVKVAGVEYQPAVASANKKQAKADAAQLALQKLGIVTQ